MPSKQQNKADATAPNRKQSKSSSSSAKSVTVGTTANTSPKQSSPTLTTIRVLSWLLLAALSSPISQLSLSPVYGTIPAYIFHARALPFIALFAFISNHFLQQHFPTTIPRYAPLLAFAIPVIQYYLFPLSGLMGPLYGPFVTELLTYFPLLVLSMYAVALLLDEVMGTGTDMGSGDGNDLNGHEEKKKWITGNGPLAESLPGLAAYMTFSFLEKASTAAMARFVDTYAVALTQLSSNVMEFSRVGLQVLVAALYFLLNPSVHVFSLALPALLHTLFLNPHWISEASTARLNAALAPYNYTLLDRQESVTGYVSVLRNDESDLLLLRCDHSLLGGEWLVTPERRANGMTQPEPVYAVFSMLEAVRLVKGDGDDVVERGDAEKSALVIGLGIGTAPSALIQHGIDTTIVEIDPVVHAYATKYFGLPTNHTAVIRNALDFADEAVANGTTRYDYIIHDVFTGGAEPVALFTADFLERLRDLLADGGVIAINYVGDPAQPSSRIIYHTIAAVFPHCRLFRESPKESSSTSSTSSKATPPVDFINSVLFCIKSPPSSTDHNNSNNGVVEDTADRTPRKPFTFRTPTERDYLGSVARRNFLLPKEELEIAYPLLPLSPIMTEEEMEKEEKEAKVMRKGETAQLERFQIGGALSHWRIMRGVVRGEVWTGW